MSFEDRFAKIPKSSTALPATSPTQSTTTISRWRPPSLLASALSFLLLPVLWTLFRAAGGIAPWLSRILSAAWPVALGGLIAYSIASLARSGKKRLDLAEKTGLVAGALWAWHSGAFPLLPGESLVIASLYVGAAIFAGSALCDASITLSRGTSRFLGRT